mgnify:FL=1|tara:strand:+ start:503 stop:853 length:351 start_codon:yes stop_codon:yes gene_type:complete
MEITTSHVLQLAIMAATVISGWAVLKNTVQRVTQDLEDFQKNFEAFKKTSDQRLDDAESDRAVTASRVSILAEISSVKNLENRNRELATIQAELKVLQGQVSHLQHIHNSKHPPTA